MSHPGRIQTNVKEQGTSASVSSYDGHELLWRADVKIQHLELYLQLLNSAAAAAYIDHIQFPPSYKPSQL